MAWRTVGTASAVFALVVVGGGPASAGPPLHDHPSPTPTTSTDEHAGHAGHEQDPAETDDGGHSGHGESQGSAVDDDTRIAVLGGFGAVNAAVIASALVLRRSGRGRRTAAR